MDLNMFKWTLYYTVQSTQLTMYFREKCLIKCRTIKNSSLNTEQSNIITYIVKSIDKLFVKLKNHEST